MNRREFLQDATVLGATLGLAPGVSASARSVASKSSATPGTRLKVGVIGCGNVSGSYIPDMLSSPYIEIVSACDIIVERAQQRAQEFKIPNVYPHVDAMLAGAKFDLLVNLTSMPSHYPVNKKGLEAKVNVWTEKPMALSVRQGKELLALAKKQGVGFWPAPTVVTSPQFRFMAETIASGKLGSITAAHGTYGHSGPTWSEWFFQKGGGCLFDLGVYNVATLTGLLGPVKEVVGMTRIVTPTREINGKTIQVTADDNTMLIMDHGKGVLSHVQCGFVYPGDDLPAEIRKMSSVDLVGTKGTMHLLGYDWGPVGVGVTTESTPLEVTCTDPGPYKWQYGASYIAECLATGKKSLLTAEHGFHFLEVMLACHESQRTGRRIKVESTFAWPIFGG